MSKVKYYCPRMLEYYSKRYTKWVTVEEGYPSDGATGAIDIWSRAWWVHDKLTDRGTWDDGTPITPWQESSVLYDILREEGRWIRAPFWRAFTWAFRAIKGRIK